MKRVFNIDSSERLLFVKSVISDIPTNGTVQVTVEPYKKMRSSQQNSLQWVSLLADFANQVNFDGKEFSSKIWHEQLKQQFLPEIPNYEETLPGYSKYLPMPDGSLKLTGSTTKLTKLGMENYLHHCFAYRCELGIRFTDKRR